MALRHGEGFPGRRAFESGVSYRDSHVTPCDLGEAAGHGREKMKLYNSIYPGLVARQNLGTSLVLCCAG